VHRKQPSSVERDLLESHSYFTLKYTTSVGRNYDKYNCSPVGFARWQERWKGGKPAGPQYDKLLYKRSRFKMIELAGEDGHGLRYERLLSRVPLGEMSPLNLPDVIRAPVCPTAGSGAPDA
jgi:hypothetical protein